MFVDILVQVDAPNLQQPLTYAVPIGTSINIGDAVLVPFRTGQAIGHIVGLKDQCPPGLEGKIKPLIATIQNAASFDAQLYELACWVTEYTLCDLRDAIRLIAPEILSSQIKTTVTLTEDWEEKLTATTRSATQKAVAITLASLGGSTTTARLTRAVGNGPIASALADLRKKGVLTEERTVSLPQAKQKVVRLLSLAVEPDIAMEEAARLERGSAPRQAKLLRALIESAQAESTSNIPVSGLAIAAGAHAAARALAEKGLASYTEAAVRRDPFRFFGFVETEAPALTDAQSKAAKAIARHIVAQDAQTILVYGVTGSGKTEVYLDAVACTLQQNKSALVVLPEIGLTAQLLDLFKARFGEDEVAVLHSGLSIGERHDEWRRIKSGAARVVIGARSAIFAPVVNLGLIIMDEEHDNSYKQDSSPRYHARDVAQYRAKQTGAVVVLGSATPALDTYWKAKNGEYELVTMSERIDNRPLPPVQIVDLREEFAPVKKQRPARYSPDGEKPPEPTPPSIFGQALTQALTDRLERREQAILFLNRRGFASFLLCRDCGFTFRCPNCDVSLTYHNAARLLQCHHCDFQRSAPDTCPQCHGLRLRPFGLGTEKVEEAVTKQFPNARTLRMDKDTMARKGAHAETLRAFRRGDADVLIGTQIVTKGLDFPNVTLVGVVSADTALNIPDFRTGERAFQLLTQVAGRAGRGNKPGQVIIQTFTPEHPSVQRAASHDYLGFYADEIEHRSELSYPPFAHLANIISSDEDEIIAQDRCHRLAETLRDIIETKNLAAQILGPVSCPLSRLRNRYRWHVVIRCKNRVILCALIQQALTQASMTDRLGLSLDIDPLSML